MEDKKIVELYWQRNEAAITETSAKYGNYCTAIAMNILGIIEDAAHDAAFHQYLRYRKDEDGEDDGAYNAVDASLH